MIYLNGEFVDPKIPLISHKDSGFTTGISIFDSMLVIDGALQHSQDHFNRIMHDSETVIGLKPFDAAQGFLKFEQIIKTLIDKNSLNRGHVRIRTTVTGGVVDTPLKQAHNLTLLIDAAPCSPPPNTPISCAIVTDFPRVAGCALENCKRLDYTRNYAARRKAESMGADEAILINTDGNIACGATSNIFIEENGILITPPLSDGVLAGVTRKNIILNQSVVKESISIKRLNSAEKVYLTNSFIGLRKVELI